MIRREIIEAMRRNRFTQNYESPITDLRRKLEKVSHTWRDVLREFRDNHASALAEKMNEIRDGFLETEEDIELFKKVIIELGYPPHESLDIPRLRQIAQDYRDYGKEHVVEYIDDLMTMYYGREELDFIAKQWEKTDFLEKRLPLLRNVIMAHNLGMYHLSVATLVTQLEGIVVNAFKVVGYVDGNIIKILLGELLLQNPKETWSYDSTIHKFYDKKILVPFEYGKPFNSDVGRNAIAHGADTDFGKETISLKIILLFDFLVEAIEELSESRIEVAQKLVREYRRNNKPKGNLNYRNKNNRNRK